MSGFLEDFAETRLFKFGCSREGANNGRHRGTRPSCVTHLPPRPSQFSNHLKTLISENAIKLLRLGDSQECLHEFNRLHPVPAAACRLGSKTCCVKPQKRMRGCA